MHRNMFMRTLGIASLAFGALVGTASSTIARPTQPQEATEPDNTAASPDDATISRARAILDEGRKARDGGDIAGARAKAVEAIELLLAAPNARESQACLRLLNDLGKLADDAGELRGAEKAARAGVEMHSRTLPDDHLDLQSWRGDLAETLRQLGDL
jgi:hypothetical protein